MSRISRRARGNSAVYRPFLTIPVRGVAPVWRKAARATIATLLAACLSTTALTARAQMPGDLPAVFSADEVTYDEELDIATATGNVEIAQGERVLKADTVSFNRRTNTVTATGNVSLLEPSGDVVFADFVELNENMRDGVAQNIRLLLADQSRLAAVSGRRVGGNVTVARNGVYSPCELCRKDPTRAPLWQIKAARITHDQTERQVTYRDAWLEMAGIPVMYTPYLSHPDATVKRRSGFLAPSLTSSSSNGLGTIVSVPYYAVLGQSSDMTIEPMWVSKNNPVLGGEYRRRFAAGEMAINATATSAERRDDNNAPRAGEQFRGHIKGDGKFDINDDWRWGFNVARATDDTYLQRYKLLTRYQFPSSTTLTSRAYTEGFYGRSYAAANAYAFQGLRPQDDSDLSPYVFPMLDYNYVGEPGSYGGHFSFDANTWSVYRTEGTRDQRVYSRAGWTLPYTASTGEIYTLSANVQGYLYNISDIGPEIESNRPTEDGFQARAFPQASLEWRYPFVNRSENFRTIVEPIVSFIAAPNVGTQSRFPNEDSRSIDFDDTNLFGRNRFSGVDRLEGGQRVVYGFNTSLSRVTGGRASAFLGQSYRLNNESAFPEGSGLEDQRSNIVGRLTFAPHPWLFSAYRFQLDRDNFEARRSFADLVIGPPSFNISTSYIFIDRSSQSTLTTDLEQLQNSINLRLSERWLLQARSVRDVGENAGQLLTGATLIYEDECFLLGLDWTRREVGNRDNPPDTAFIIRLIFRNLGEVQAKG